MQEEAAHYPPTKTKKEHKSKHAYLHLMINGAGLRAFGLFRIPFLCGVTCSFKATSVALENMFPETGNPSNIFAEMRNRKQKAKQTQGETGLEGFENPPQLYTMHIKL